MMSHFVAKTTNQFSNFCRPGVPKSILFGKALEQFICWAIGRSLIFSIDGEVGQKYTLILGKSIAYRWTFKTGYFRIKPYSKPSAFSGQNDAECNFWPCLSMYQIVHIVQGWLRHGIR